MALVAVAFIDAGLFTADGVASRNFQRCFGFFVQGQDFDTFDHQLDNIANGGHFGGDQLLADLVWLAAFLGGGGPERFGPADNIFNGGGFAGGPIHYLVCFPVLAKGLEKNPRTVHPGVFEVGWVTKWGFGVSGEFSCLLDYPGGF